MPELIEAELYRRAADACRGRVVNGIAVPDPRVVRHGPGARALRRRLVGRPLQATARHGKVVLLDFDDARLGLRFGMTGRLLVDGQGPIDRLEYGPAGDGWIRFELRFEGGGRLSLVDPRR